MITESYTDEDWQKLKDKRKAEIKRIAEQVYLSTKGEYVTHLNGIRDSIKYALAFVDNFDAEFERLEGKG